MSLFKNEESNRLFMLPKVDYVSHNLSFCVQKFSDFKVQSFVEFLNIKIVIFNIKN